MRSSIGRPAFEKDMDAPRASGMRPWLLIGEPNFHDPAYLADLYWLLDSARVGLFEGVALNVERQKGVTLDVWSERFLAVLKHLAGSPNRKLAIVVHHDDAIALEQRGAFAFFEEIPGYAGNALEKAFWGRHAGRKVKTCENVLDGEVEQALACLDEILEGRSSRPPRP